MLHRQNTLFWVVAIMLALCVVTFQALADSNAQKKVLARVNGVDVMQWEISLTQAVFLGAEVLGNIVSKKEILENIINAELLYQNAVKKGFKANESVIDDIIWNYKRSFPSLALYRNGLASTGITENDLRRVARRILVALDLMQKKKCIDDLMVSDAEAKDYYENNPDKFKKGDLVHAGHILIKFGNDPKTPDRKTALKKAQDTKRRLTNEEPFAKVARKVSGCPSKDMGGDMGYFSLDALKGTELEPIWQALSELKPGQVSDIIESEFGFHIVMLENLMPGTLIPFDNVEKNLKISLEKRKVISLVNNLARKLKDNAKIERFCNP